MKLAIRYLAQAKQAAGQGSDEIELDCPCPAGDLLARLADQRGEPLRRLLVATAGSAQPSLLLFLGDEQIQRDQLVPRRDGEVLTILTPMAGG